MRTHKIKAVPTRSSALKQWRYGGPTFVCRIFCSELCTYIFLWMFTCMCSVIRYATTLPPSMRKRKGTYNFNRAIVNLTLKYNFPEIKTSIVT